jgi:hypothetical protein
MARSVHNRVGDRGNAGLIVLAVNWKNSLRLLGLV